MKKVFFWFVGFAILIQFIRPDFTNPKVNNSLSLNADTKVMHVLKTSCYDCHSDETRYPWYHNLAPVSWVMSSNIKNGRKALDFSNWTKIDPSMKLKRLKRAKQLVNNGLMPKGEYLLIHDKAVLNKEKKEILEQFFDAQIDKLQNS